MDSQQDTLLGGYIANPLFRIFLNLGNKPNLKTTAIIAGVGYLLLAGISLVAVGQNRYNFLSYFYLSILFHQFVIILTPGLWFLTALGAFVMVRQTGIDTDKGFRSLRRAAISGPDAVIGILHRFRLLFAFLIIIAATSVPFFIFGRIPLSVRVFIVLVILMFNGVLLHTIVACITFGVWAGLRLRSGIFGFIAISVIIGFTYQTVLLAASATGLLANELPLIGLMLFFTVLVIPPNLATVALLRDLRGRVYTAYLR